MSIRKIVTTCTRDCPNTCGLVATVEDGRLTGLRGNPDHPLTRGAACRKTTAKYADRVYSPERVTRPMVRRNDTWVQVSWDEALDLVADKMKAICAESGPEAILYYQGYGERTALKLLNKYFFNLLGGATTMRGSLCGGAGQGSQNLDFGVRVSHDPLDHLNSGSIVLWARNPVSTNVSLVPIIREVKKRGGRVIVIDPARSRSVSLADRHIMPRPGGDGWLAMAASKLILEAGAEDREFLENHCTGWVEYRAILDRYDMATLCARAGVSEVDVRFLAETYMEQGPTATLLGWGLHRYEHAHLQIRPIDALGAISGNIGVAGGGVSQGFEEYGPYDPQYWGDHLHPEARTFLIPRVGEEILNATEPPVRMIYVTAGNPLCMAPNSSKIAEGFAKAEMVVYSGHFMDDTAELADVFLPATTFLEEDDLVASYGHNYVGPVNRAIEPVGQCKSEFHMFYELASRFPFAGDYRRSVDEWLELICTPIWEQGGTLEELRKGPLRLNEPMVPYEDKTFSTPSGKFQLMEEFEPPEEAPSRKQGEPNERFPYKLLTIAPHGYICSERTVAEHEPLPVVQLNSDEAAKKGLRDGSVVVVESCVGRVRARLATDPDMRRDVLIAERGGWTKAGHGLNLLTIDMASLVGNGTPFYETGVDVLPVSESEPRVLVVWNSGRAPGGTFAKELEHQGAALEVVNPSEGDQLPETHDGFDALVVLGGPQHAFDDESAPYFPALMALMRGFDGARKPVAGLCLGCQLLARAHGATVWTMPALEFGFVGHAPTEAAANDPLLGPVLAEAGLPRLMEFHEDSFDLPEGAELLVRGETCAHQAFRVGNCSHGFQFHMEVDSAIVSSWMRLFLAGDMENYARYREQYDEAFFEELGAELPILVSESEAFCRRVAARWLKLVRA